MITKVSRRQFLRTSAAVAGFPAIVPSTVFGKSAPSNLIQIGQIGYGRIARTHDVPENLQWTDVGRYVAVCDLDSVRLEDAKRHVESFYEEKLGRGKYSRVKTYADYRQMLEDKSVDAVCISTPDHWHAQPAMEAALAGKDVYLQKPASLTIVEGRQMADTMKKTKRIFQQGSQQRSDLNFRLACELIRNGRIGHIKEVLIGLPKDEAGGDAKEMPVPPNLNYEMWLGSTPAVPYTEDRVHPQTGDLRKRYVRPHWLRCEQFGAGMITGWGVHHFDIAHWAMGMEHSGPVSIVAQADFPKKGLWDVHGAYVVRARYPNGAVVYVTDKYPTGVRFIGEDGWIWVTRGDYKAGEPAPGQRNKALDASDPNILRAGIKDNEIHLHASPENNHHLDWLMSIRTRKEPVAPAEDGHRACSACLVSHAAMKLGRELRWDPEKEQFLNDDEANGMLRRPQRAPWGTDYILAKRG